ncbi:MAG: hypothetical protein PVH25_13710 [Burkholderiales bacterium]|jgi:Spy/CpxP family protein refolding chaperone
MSTRGAKTGKWVGIMMIVLGVIILVVSLGMLRPGYHGLGSHAMFDQGTFGHGMFGHPYNRFGHPMMGDGPMRGAWMGSYGMGSYGMPYPGAMMGTGMMPGLQAMQGLDLTQEQQARIEAVQVQIREQLWRLLESLRAENEKLQTLLLGGSIDAGALMKQYEQCAGLRRQVFELDVKGRQLVDEILTDDQRRQWHRWQRDYLQQ